MLTGTSVGMGSLSSLSSTAKRGPRKTNNCNVRSILLITIFPPFSPPFPLLPNTPRSSQWPVSCARKLPCLNATLSSPSFLRPKGHPPTYPLRFPRSYSPPYLQIPTRTHVHSLPPRPHPSSPSLRPHPNTSSTTPGTRGRHMPTPLAHLA